METFETTSLVYPRLSPKMDAIYGALTEGWPNASINNDKADLFFIWGLIGNNIDIMKNKKYNFIDMPYNGRWTQGANWDKTYWRVSPLGLHDQRKLDVSIDRFESWNVKIQPWVRGGSFILICPSSETVTRMIHNMSVHEWVDSVVKAIRQYSNIPIKIRNKPRKNGTSGPSVADVTIEEDLVNCTAVVISASLCGIDALKAGVPVFSTTKEHSSVMWCSNYDFSKINNAVLFDREDLFANLAWKQYSIKEMREGFYYEHYCRLQHN